MSQDIAIRKEISFQLLNSNDGDECSVNKRSKINKKFHLARIAELQEQIKDNKEQVNYKELLIDEKLQKMFITTVLSIVSTHSQVRAHPRVRAHPPNFDSSVVCEVLRVTTTMLNSCGIA